MNKTPKFLTLSQVAKRIGVSPSTVRNILLRREIPHFRIGATYRIDEEEIEKYLKRAYVNQVNETTPINES